ncbi:MAG TPA: hypothetical protein VGM25_07630 [Caulobacteraceae bacterium]
MAEVFWFRMRDPATGRVETYPKKGTEDAISRLGGEKLWGSVEEVDAGELDANGLYEQPQGRLADLSPQNRALVERLQIDIDGGDDWDRLDLSGEDLDRLLDAARDEGRDGGRPTLAH